MFNMSTVRQYGSRLRWQNWVPLLYNGEDWMEYLASNDCVYIIHQTMGSVAMMLVFPPHQILINSRNITRYQWEEKSLYLGLWYVPMNFFQMCYTAESNALVHSVRLADRTTRCIRRHVSWKPLHKKRRNLPRRYFHRYPGPKGRHCCEKRRTRQPR